MANIENEAVILRQSLGMPDTRLYRDLYGVDFVPGEPGLVDDFGRLCDSLVKERQKLNDLCKALAITVTKQSVVYEPTVFLDKKLSSDQITAINSQESTAVAEYCRDVQAELAKVPIVESNERMVHLPALFSVHDVPIVFSDMPFHASCGDWAGKERLFWVREGVAYRLLILGKLLETTGVQLYLEDAFRPPGVQEGLFKRRVNWTRRDHPDWSDEQVIIEAKSKTAVMPRLASHMGGAAIDALLQDRANGQLLDFGHNYPDGGALVFPKSPFIVPEQWRNRQLFQAAAGLSDLTLYVGEDWHVSYGDNLASLDEEGNVRPEYVAIYGPIKDFDPLTGTILKVYSNEEKDKIFDY